MDIVNKFADINVLIVGDVMLDRYWWGSVSRISPEAPVPVVNLTKTTTVAGGAANVAANVAGLGAKPILVGVVGNDADGESFPKVLSERNVSGEFLHKVKGRTTTVKTRIVGHHQQIVRIDQETKKALEQEAEDNVWSTVKELLEKAQIVIVSDYGKGFLSRRLISRLITLARDENIIVLIDPKGKDFTKYIGATLLTPNRFEVAEACRLENYEQDALETVGGDLLKQLCLDALLITQGEDGMTLFQNKKRSVHLAASARDVYDVTGAGDTVIACLAVAMGSGIDIVEACKIANVAAGIIVEQMGTTAISLEMLKNAFNK